MEQIVMDKDGYLAYWEGIKELENKLALLREFKGKVAIHEGNAWHDNFSFEQAELEERMLMNEIARRKTIIENIIIVEKKTGNGVELNDVIDLEISTDLKKTQMKIKLVTHLSNKKSEIKEVTISSPIGRAIYEKEIGESFSYNVHSKKITGKIINIFKENQKSKIKIQEK